MFLCFYERIDPLKIKELSSTACCIALILSWNSTALTHPAVWFSLSEGPTHPTTAKIKMSCITMPNLHSIHSIVVSATHSSKTIQPIKVCKAFSFSIIFLANFHLTLCLTLLSNIILETCIVDMLDMLEEHSYDVITDIYVFKEFGWPWVNDVVVSIPLSICADWVI